MGTVLLALGAAGCGGDDESPAGAEVSGGGAGMGAGGGSGTGGGGGSGGGGSGAGGDDGDGTETCPGGPAWPGGPNLSPVVGASRTNKVDVLFVVDNSLSMGDKQAVLRDTVADMLTELTAEGSGVDDLHVGVITSSLGGLGSSICEPRSTTTALRAEMENDRAHLVGARPRAAALGVTADFAEWARGGSSANLAASVEGMVGAAGEYGCGYESTLEAAYRFLADPAPPTGVRIAGFLDHSDPLRG